MDFYEKLGVPHDATTVAIRTAYRGLALRYHPDVPGTGSAQRFREIQEAYETLSVPSRRRAYDSSRQSGPRKIPITIIRPRATTWSAPPEPLRAAARRTDSVSEFEQFFAEVIRWFERDWF